MTVSVLIDETPLRLRAARVGDDIFEKTLHLYTDRKTPRRGMLYRVKVTTIDKRMNAAFCDMGGGIKGFLRRAGPLPNEGTRLIVEVKREGAFGKGPDLSDRPVWRWPTVTLMLDGEPREGVLPTSDENYKTACTEIKEQAEALTTDGPLGVVGELPLIVSVMMVMAEGGVDDVIVTSGAMAEQMRPFMGDIVPLQTTEPLPARAAFDETDDDALARVVTLPGGGRLIIDQAEALTAIDFDLGRQSGQSQRGAASRLLMEAMETLSRYSVLAQLGGQIVLDIPRGAIAAPKIVRDQATRAFRPLGKISVPAVTPEGICVVIAPKPAPSLLAQLTKKAPANVRDGLQFRTDVMAAKAYEALALALAQERSATLVLTVNPAIARYFAEGNKPYQTLVEQFGSRFLVAEDANQEAFDVR